MNIEEKIKRFEELGGYITEHNNLKQRIETVQEDFRIHVGHENMTDKYPDVINSMKDMWVAELKQELRVVEGIIMDWEF